MNENFIRSIEREKITKNIEEKVNKFWNESNKSDDDKKWYFLMQMVLEEQKTQLHTKNYELKTETIKKHLTCIKDGIKNKNYILYLTEIENKAYIDGLNYALNILQN